MSYLPVLELTRGGIVESIHHGAIAVADAQGELRGVTRIFLQVLPVEGGLTGVATCVREGDALRIRLA